MSPISDKTALVVDNGLFLPFAQRLARDFKRVLYHVPGHSPFPKLEHAVIGDGFSDVHRVFDMWTTHEKFDIVVVPDVSLADIQEMFEHIGFPVWGSRRGDAIELNRSFLKSKQEELGMDVPKYEQIKGLNNLTVFLIENQNVYVKLSKYRGTMETFHSVDYKTSRPWLDSMAVKLGPLREEVEFVVELAIDAVAELGFDGFCIDGLFPQVAVQGIEAKDRGYIGIVRPYDSLPEELTSVNLALSSFLRQNNYRNFFSTEVRITDAATYLTDPCCRHASPAGECLDELYSNLGEIIWDGAFGHLVEPVYAAKFAAQALIDHPGDENGWRIVNVPEKARRWVKIFFACEADGRICVPPLPWNHSTIGSVIGLGDTIEEAISALKKNASALDGQGLTIHIDAVADVLKEIREAEKSGVEVTDQPVPKPETVMQES